MPVHTYSHTCSQQKGFLVSMVSGGSLDSTCYSSLHMCCVHTGTAISEKKKCTFLKYFLMDNLIDFAKSLPSISLTPENGMTHKYPKISTGLLHHGTSTTGEQPFQNRRGKSPVLQDQLCLVPLELFKFNAKEEEFTSRKLHYKTQICLLWKKK